MGERDRFVPEKIGENPRGSCPFPERGASRGTRAAHFQRLTLDGAGGSGPQQPAANQVANAPPPPDPQIELQQQLEAAMAEAKREGHAQGLDEGREAGRAEFAEAVAGVAKMLDKLELTRTRLVEGHRMELIELIATIARSIIETELTNDPAMMSNMLDRALAMLGDEPSYVVHLPPGVCQALGDWQASQATQGRTVTLRPDDSLALGDIHVSTEAGTLEANFANRIATARTLMLGKDLPELEQDADD